MVLFKHFAPWRAMFGVEFDMQPAFTDEEAYVDLALSRQGV